MANITTEKDNEKKEPDTQNKEIIRSIFEKCKYESAHGLQAPLELYRERVLYYTGTPEDVLDEIIGVQPLTFDPDLFDRAVINDALKTLYLQHESFSFSEIYEKVKGKVKVPEINKFCSILRQLGYKPMNTLNYGKIIVEDPKLTYERFRYLNKMRKYRDSPKTIYYIDERVIDLNTTFKKPWVDHKDISKIEGYILFHIVSRTGFERGLFCNKVNAEDFHKWVSDIVLSFIHPSSLIIMDNNPLHGKIASEAITRYHSKAYMLKWLHRNNIPCSPNMRKAELYDLIARCPVQDTQHEVDLIFKSHGHEVLRLPENYHDLSITELLWEHIRSHSFDFASITNLNSLKNKVYTAATTVSMEKWLQFDNTIKDTEKNIFLVDEDIERVLNAYEFDVSDVINNSK